MKQIFPKLLLVISITFFSVITAKAQTDMASTEKMKPALKTFLIERDIPGAGQLTATDLKGISQKSCTVIKDMGDAISWVQSFVTGNKIYCVYRAENETLLREHAKKGGFPITSITEINNTISPKTAE